jgi:hypothetical protein
MNRILLVILGAWGAIIPFGGPFRLLRICHGPSSDAR